MIVGIPTEVKTAENRVAMTPDGVRGLTSLGHHVRVQSGAGIGSSFSDADFAAAGADMVSAEDAWASELVCKVKEPQESEFGYMREDLVLFTYLHLAAYPEVAKALFETKTTGIAYETVQTADGDLPLLAPMSEVAGRIATQVGASLLEKRNGTRGILLGGVPGVRAARVVVIGAGHVGWNAAWIAQGMEAEVLLLDRNIDRLRWVDQIHKGRIMTLASNRGSIERALLEADLLIGAVLVAGGRAPIVVDDEMVAMMRPGSVIVDVAVDQGGCIETTHETTHEDPDVLRARRAALRRRQHAGRRAAHLHLRAHQRHAALRARPCRARGPRRRIRRPRSEGRRQHCRRCVRERSRCRGPRRRGGRPAPAAPHLTTGRRRRRGRAGVGISGVRNLPVPSPPHSRTLGPSRA